MYAARCRHLLAWPARSAPADVPEIAGRGGPQGHRLQFRTARAIARRRRQRRGRSDPAACFRGKAASDGPRWCMARLDHAAVQRFFPDAADGAERRPVARRRCAAAQTGRDRSGETLFRLGTAASARQFGAVSAIPRSHRGGVHRTDAARRTDAGLAGAAAPPDFRMAQAARLASPFGYSCRDLWSGGADRARPPRRRTALCAAEEIVLCRSCRTKAVLRAAGFFGADRRSRHYRTAHFPERPRQPAPRCRQPVCVDGATVRDGTQPRDVMSIPVESLTTQTKTERRYIAARLAKHPIFLINELHEVDAFDLHRVTHARNFREAGRASLFRNNGMPADFCQRDYKWISLEFFLSRRH